MGKKLPLQPNGAAQFPEPHDVGPRPWGREILLCVASGHYTFKRLEMKAGAKGGLQYHHKKDEAGYILEGELLVRYDSGTGELRERVCKAGDVVHFPQGAVHQEEALTDCVILEVSTPFLNDRVRVEEHYGLQTPQGGLPSTTPDEVEAL
jgi:mannose-1-phosphate guanylyltransferase